MALTCDELEEGEFYADPWGNTVIKFNGVIERIVGPGKIQVLPEKERQVLTFTLWTDYINLVKMETT